MVAIIVKYKLVHIRQNLKCFFAKTIIKISLDDKIAVFKVKNCILYHVYHSAHA